MSIEKGKPDQQRAFRAGQSAPRENKWRENGAVFALVKSVPTDREERRKAGGAKGREKEHRLRFTDGKCMRPVGLRMCAIRKSLTYG